jgi:hypothetical protein
MDGCTGGSEPTETYAVTGYIVGGLTDVRPFVVFCGSAYSRLFD